LSCLACLYPLRDQLILARREVIQSTDAPRTIYFPAASQFLNIPLIFRDADVAVTQSNGSLDGNDSFSDVSTECTRNLRRRSPPSRYHDRSGTALVGWINRTCQHHTWYDRGLTMEGIVPKADGKYPLNRPPPLEP